MKKMIRLAMVLVILVFVSFCAPTAHAYGSTKTVNISVQYDQTEARTMLDLLNDMRLNGDDELGTPWYWNSSNTQKVCPTLKPLTYDYGLEAIAMQRAAEIAVSFSHTRPDGSRCFSAPGYDVYISRAENVAMGSGYYASAANALSNWAEHDRDYAGQAHRRNMLGDFAAVGVAHVFYNGYHYWVQEFSGAARNTTPTAANNGIASVSIDILDGLYDLSCSESSILAEVGVPCELPTLEATVLTVDTWPGFPCPLDEAASWRVENSKIASISGNTLVPLAKGTTRLVGTCGGQTVSIPVKVTPCTTFDVKLSSTVFAYTGSQIKPTVTVTDAAGNVLKENVHYTVRYASGCTEAGTYSVTVMGKLGYSIRDVLQFSILPAMKLPSILSTIEAEAFTGMGFQMVIIPAGVNSIESRAFANCGSLKVLTFESNPSSIADDILSGCSNVIIRAPQGGTADRWAQSHGYTVEYI